MDAITNLITMIFPSISQTLASTIALGLAFVIGALMSIPAILLWIRKHMPTIIAFLIYVYEQTEKAERALKNVNDKYVPLAGAEKKEQVLKEVTKQLLEPKNEVVTSKTLKVFKKIVGGIKSVGDVIEWVLPLAKLLKKKK